MLEKIVYIELVKEWYKRADNLKKIDSGKSEAIQVLYLCANELAEIINEQQTVLQR